MTALRPIILCAIMLGIAFSCPPAGSSAAQGDKGDPKGKTPANLQEMEKVLAELERRIQASEKELAEVKKLANTLRSVIAAAKQPADGKAITSAAQLLAGLPKEKYPKSGEDGIFERNAANKWVKENVVGKTIEVSFRVQKVLLENAAEDTYNVTLLPDFGAMSIPTASKLRDTGLYWDRQAKLGAESFTVSVIFESGKGLGFTKVDEDRAKQLRDLKDQQVTMVAVVSKAEFHAIVGFGDKALILRLDAQIISINALKPLQKK